MEQNIFTHKKIILYSTFNIHENATLPLLILQINKKLFEEVFQIM
jgi:hypothetical protein